MKRKPHRFSGWRPRIVEAIKQALRVRAASRMRSRLFPPRRPRHSSLRRGSEDASVFYAAVLLPFDAAMPTRRLGCACADR